MTKIVTVEGIEQKIFLIRGQKVMLDRDLADLYGVKPIALRQQVKRNPTRFPVDFMFQLQAQDVSGLVSQNVIPSRQVLGGHLPYVFTEQGIAMLSSVLSSERAVQVNIAIMRAFVKLREVLSAHKDLAFKLKELEHAVGRHDEAIQNIFTAIRQLMAPPPDRPKRKIGFLT